jgi:polysaccharide export outer membrane protein
MQPMKKIILAAWTLIAAAFVTTEALAQSGYRIRSGDILSVEVLQDPSLNREVLVLPDGSITFPFAGSVSAAGLTTGQVQAQIAQGIAPNFAVQPSVFVNVSQVFRPDPALLALNLDGPRINVYYLGEVATPGLVEVIPGTTLFQGLALGGGFTDFAATGRIQLRRAHPETGVASIVTIDYDAIADGAVLRNDPPLAEGDVILVPERRLFE